MGKIKQFFCNLSFRVSFVVYVAVALFAAYLAVGFTVGYCKIAIIEGSNYESSENGISYLTGEGLVVAVTDIPVDTPENRMRIAVFNTIKTLCVPIYLGVALVAAAMLFYRNKMKKPMAALMGASRKILGSDLDFRVDYQGGDEMGKLCGSFEKMRAALAENNRLMWRQVEQRRRLNAAFAHDLRTPLTVLKGHVEIMRQKGQAGTENVAAMAKQIDRLERYAESMGSMQKLEEVQPEYQAADLRRLAQPLARMAEFVCGRTGKRLDFRSHIANETVVLDESIVCQVAENLVANAARYAKNNVAVDFSERDEMVILDVRDDGGGFSAAGMKRAAEPYYSEDADRANHFGLGLYISKILCETHGGGIKIENRGNGAVVTASFRIKAEPYVDKK